MWNHLITPESARDMTGEPQSLFKTGLRPQTVQRKHNPLSTAPDDTQNTAHVQSESDSQRKCDIKINSQEKRWQESKHEAKKDMDLLFTSSLLKGDVIF